jgi:hypothetical protein
MCADYLAPTRAERSRTPLHHDHHDRQLPVTSVISDDEQLDAAQPRCEERTFVLLAL